MCATLKRSVEECRLINNSPGDLLARVYRNRFEWFEIIFSVDTKDRFVMCVDTSGFVEFGWPLLGVMPDDTIVSAQSLFSAER